MKKTLGYSAAERPLYMLNNIFLIWLDKVKGTYLKKRYTKVEREEKEGEKEGILLFNKLFIQVSLYKYIQEY